MKLVNVAVETLGAKIKTYSSSLDTQQQPHNILHPNQSTLWATGQGIPQFVIVSLFKNLCEVGFMLWHDYDTNPKEIELWVAETTEQEFVFWARFELEQKKGIQLYEIKPLPAKYIYLKISITQTYGGFETYLNQVFFMAEDVTKIRQQPKSRTQNKETLAKGKKKQLNLQDLQSNLNQLVEIDRRISRSKSNKKNKQQKKLNRMSRQGEIQVNNNKNNKNKNDAREENQKYPLKEQLSKGSFSSNRAGRSIYYRSQQHVNDDQSHQFLSHQYQSSSSNNNNPLQIKKAKQKISSQESQEFSHSMQSNNTALSPSLNITSQLNSYSMSGNQLFTSNKQFKSTKQINDQNKKSFKRLIDREKKQTSKKKTKEYSEEDDNQGYQEESGRKEIQYGNDIQQQQQEVQQDEQVGQDNGTQQDEEQEQEQEFSNDLIKNTPKYHEVSQQYYNDDQNHQNSQSVSQQQSSSQSINNYNVAILALSKHVVKLQDNMEQIQRKVQVLDLKVAHSHQKIQQEIFQKVQNKVEEIVDRKLQKIWSLKNILNVKNQQINNESDKKKRSHKQHKQAQTLENSTKEKDELKFNYKKNLTKEFFKSDYYSQQQNMAQMRDKTKTKRRSKEKYHQKQQNRQLYNKGDYYDNQVQRDRMRPRQMMNRLKTSKSFTNITKQCNTKKIKDANEATINDKISKRIQKGPNQQYIADLLERLNTKLKQRQVKLNRMQVKEKQKQHNVNDADKRKKYELKERTDHQRRAITNTNDYYYC